MMGEKKMQRYWLPARGDAGRTSRALCSMIFGEFLNDFRN